MEPTKGWTHRKRLLFAVALFVGVLVLVAVVAAIPEKDLSDAKKARYVRVRRECTQVVDGLGFTGDTRVDAINKCMVDRS